MWRISQYQFCYLHDFQVRQRLRYMIRKLNDRDWFKNYNKIDKHLLVGAFTGNIESIPLVFNI